VRSAASRNRLAGACQAAALVALLLAVVVGYAERALFSSEQFADRAAAALQDDRVRTRVATELTDGVVLANAADLQAARPLIEQAAEGVVGGTAFRQLFRAAVLDVHRAVFDRDLDTVTLTVADAGTVVAGAVEVLQPSLAARIRADARITLAREQIDERAAGLVRLAERVQRLAGILALLALALATGGVWLAPDRRRAVARLGAGAAAVGVVIVLGYAVARWAVLREIAQERDRDAAAGIWDAFLSDLRAAGWALAAIGAVVAAAAASLLPPVGIEPALRRLGRLATAEPARPALRVLRAVGLITAGVLIVTRPAAFLSLLATIGGVLLVYAGATALLRLVYRPPERAARAPRRRVAVAALAVVLAGATVAAFLAGGGASVAAPAPAGYNGHTALCDRPLDDVVLAATHNAMSAGPEWYASQQDAPIADQLADGVRGLLIDTHYADRLPSGRVRTELENNVVPRAQQDGVSEAAIAAALRIRDRLGFRGEGERGMYLCHTLCELGATPLADALDDVHDFLVTHPGEVVVVINQDYVTPRDFVGAVGAAGLADDVYTPPAGGDWATLGELVASGRRLVILAENEAGAAPWYQLVYEQLVQETPFSFGRVAQLLAPELLDASCAANRGPDGAPLFLVNHWITTDPRPLPSNADAINAREPLLRRVRDCERLRGQLPNLVAVDFYRRGDLFAVVDELNGVG
jgi:hypothetical protein